MVVARLHTGSCRMLIHDRGYHGVVDPLQRQAYQDRRGRMVGCAWVSREDYGESAVPSAAPQGKCQGGIMEGTTSMRIIKGEISQRTGDDWREE